MSITPVQFQEAFEQTKGEQLPTLLACWSSQPKFTAYFKQDLMPRVAELLNCNTETEYRRIDVVLTREPRHVVVAVEHENNFGGSALSEIVKLRQSEASLGVMITYVGHRQRARMIQEYNAAMKAGFGDEALPTCLEILVIIGPYGMKPPSVLEWAYYVYDGQEFRPL